MKYRALLFDMDETLLADAEGSREALVMTALVACRQYTQVSPDALAAAAWEVARRRWRHSPAPEYCDRIGISAHEALWGYFTNDYFPSDDPALRQLTAWAPGFHRAVWEDALARCGVKDQALAVELAGRFEEERLKRSWLFADAPDMMKALEGKYALALVTNGAPDMQRRKLGGARLNVWVDEIVVSGELGIGKPDPRIFTHTLQLLEAEPADAIMVGDSLSRDIAGAHAAGIRAIWLRRDPTLAADPAIVPDAIITTLAELPALLQQWEA